jgi:hypothetical protein
LLMGYSVPRCPIKGMLPLVFTIVIGNNVVIVKDLLSKDDGSFF